MSDGGLRGYPTSRKNLVGLAGAAVGLGLNLGGVIGDVWPAAAVGLYAIGALVTPPDRPEPGSLTDELRRDADGLLELVQRRTLPPGAGAAVSRIVLCARTVLDRLDETADDPADRAAAPERLATVAEILRVDLPSCLDAYLARPDARAAAELATQLDLVAPVADRLAAAVPEASVQRAEELTQELRRRYPPM
ncbi:hypothetical protein GCM10009836_38360 [Pseudonocardia ailaonensis]|uniref:5-bromo-4-chloroindolyl phosphate hydrolysis protein n=1 Tax=Pseudonocardia ailaonensis TaxID=367279 RepID=A0ABN2N6L1_9PSEU